SLPRFLENQRNIITKTTLTQKQKVIQKAGFNRAIFVNFGQSKKESIKIKRILYKLMRLPELLIQNKFSQLKIAKIKEYIEKLAIKKVLEERPQNLKRVARIKFNPTHQIMIKLVVLLVGSVVYSNTFRIYTINFGNLAWLVAIIGGFVASGGVDYLATQVCSQYLCRQITRRALNQLESQKNQQLKEGENQFIRGFWDSKINFIFNVEGGILAQSHEINLLGQKISIYVIAAVVLNLIEFTGAFYLVSKLGLFEDLPIFIRLVISSLPVVLTWMMAFVQADWFERPQYARELLNKYNKKAQGMITEPIDQMYRTLVRLDAGIEQMLSSKSEYPTVELAELDADIRYFGDQMEDLQEEGKLKIQSLKNKYERQKKEIEAEYPQFEQDLRGLADIDLERLKQEYETQKAQTLDAEFQKIEEIKQQKIKELSKELTEQLEELKIKQELAVKKFNRKKAEFDSEGNNIKNA
ncbi:MAG TPA: hypothetical protein DCF68_02660, partial [Cyanothece sp. UBA12306]|nr:hypothetical protein [Cyanothece sp. UBA12306]